MHRLAVLVRSPPTCLPRSILTDGCWAAPSLPRRVIEMQAFLGELLETFQFDLPKGNVEIQCAPAGSGMVPIVRGKPELGAALPLRISLVQ